MSIEISSDRRRVEFPNGEVRAYEAPLRSFFTTSGPPRLLLVEEAEFGTRNLVCLDEEGRELWRTGASDGLGTIDQLIPFAESVRAVEVTARGDFQLQIDIETGAVLRVAEWR